MKIKRTIISSEVKEKIMAEANLPGSIVSKVAAKYKIAPYLLYTWRSKARRLDCEQPIIQSEKNQTRPNFVEAVLSDPVGATPKHAQLLLKKLSLEFEDFSLGIEGKFSSKKLMQLITILEQSC